MSKMKFGLQFTHKVKVTEVDSNNKDIKATQIAQNKVLRLLDGTQIKFCRSISNMLEKSQPTLNKPDISPDQTTRLPNKPEKRRTQNNEPGKTQERQTG